MSKQNVLELHAQLFRRIARRDLEAVEDSLDLLRGQNFLKYMSAALIPKVVLLYLLRLILEIQKF